jgi:hypothetical protein
VACLKEHSYLIGAKIFEDLSNRAQFGLGMSGIVEASQPRSVPKRSTSGHPEKAKADRWTLPFAAFVLERKERLPRSQAG